MRASTFRASLVALSVICASGTASAGDEVAAEALFNEAKKLVAQRKYAQACPLFAESNRLDRGAGTMLHLADCYEKNKQAASAWATYKDASSAAQALNRKDWEKLANQRAAALEPKLARLTITVDAANGDNVEVTRDGSAVAKASWGIAIPVDTGSHTVAAKASGYLPFSTSITVAKDGEKLEVTVPKLEAEPVAAAPPPAPAPKPVTSAPPDADANRGGSSQRLIGFVVGGIGVAGLAVGAVTALMAMGKSNDAKEVCTAGACASQRAVDDADGARSFATVATIGFIGGGVALAAGAVLVLTAPSPKKSGALRFVPSAGPRNAGFALQGTF